MQVRDVISILSDDEKQEMKVKFTNRYNKELSCMRIVSSEIQDFLDESVKSFSYIDRNSSEQIYSSN